MKLTRPIIFFDLETTGTSVTNDRIVELAMAKYATDYSLIAEKCVRINPTIPIPKGASDVHGITDEDVKDCPTFKNLSKGVLEFINGCDIAGYNSINFDVPLLYTEFTRVGLLWDYHGVKFIDACNIFKIKEGRTLTDAVRFYCNEEMENAHSALDDVRATVCVFREQVERYKMHDKTIDELALMSNFDKPILDISGRFTMNADNKIVFTFGKHKNEVASDNKDYLDWMINKGDFAEDTKAIARQILYNKPKDELPF